MSIKILTNKKVEDFKVYTKYRISDFAVGDDSYRSSRSTTVEAVFSFSFENEKEEDGNYSYDLSVVEYGDGRPRDMTATEEMEENFHFIITELKGKGISVMNIAAAMFVEISCCYADNAGNITRKVKFSGGIHPVNKDNSGNVITASELIAYISEKDERAKWLKIARAIGDHTLPYGKYDVWLESIPDEIYGKEVAIQIPEELSVDDLIKSGVANDEDIKQALVDFAARAEFGVTLWDTDKIERFIMELPDDQKKEVLKHCRQTSRNLQMLRDYCPEKINWQLLEIDEYLESDLDLMIQNGKCVDSKYESQQWEFIRHCMATKPELERRVVDNAYVLGCDKLSEIARNLRVCSTSELLRSILYHEEKPNAVGLSYSSLACIFELEYEGLDRNDYNSCLALSDKSVNRDWTLSEKENVSNMMLAFVLKVGIIAGVSEEELVKMLHDKKEAYWGVKLHGWILESTYTEYSFVPGIALVKAERDLREAEKRRLAKERAESNEKVVKFAQDSAKLAVRVSVTPWPSSSGEYYIYRPDRKPIGDLCPNEQRVLLVWGKRWQYLIDVERVKKIRSGVFHFDILEEDAGYIIGHKGSHIKEITESLNRLGCQLRMIKIHPHAE